MQVISRYDLNLTGVTTVFMPVDWALLSVEFISGRLVLFATGDPDQQHVEIELIVLRTGEVVDEKYNAYFGTVVIGAVTILHIFANDLEIEDVDEDSDSADD